MSAFYDLSKTPRNILNQAIVRAIVSENNGALFDPSDLSTLYQDTAGTIPVTAVEQPVGLMLDKSRGVMLGPDKPTFLGNGWSLSAGVYSKSATGWSNLGVTGCDLGRIYKVTFRVKTILTGSSISVFRRNIGNAANDAPASFTISVGQTYTAYIPITLDGFTPCDIWLDSDTFTGSVDNFSVKELYGYHATQPITASRPTLSARKNILLATETLATQSITTLAATYTLSFTGAGSVALSGTATGTLTGTGANDRVSFTITPTAGTLTLTVSGGVTKAQLELGAVAGPYQRVNTATDYDTDERYFPKYLRFDGVDDYLNLPYMGLYAGGSASVVAGLNGHNYNTSIHGRVISETSSSSVIPAYAPIIHTYFPDNTTAYIRNDASTTLSYPSFGIPQNKLSITSVIDSGLALKSYKNTLKTSGIAYTRGGSLTLDSTTIGKSIGQGSTEVWKGELYGLIVTKSALADSQRIACERYLGRKSGVQL